MIDKIGRTAFLNKPGMSSTKLDFGQRKKTCSHGHLLFLVATEWRRSSDALQGGPISWIPFFSSCLFLKECSCALQNTRVSSSHRSPCMFKDDFFLLRTMIVRARASEEIHCP